MTMQVDKARLDEMLAALRTIIECNDEGPGLIDCIDNDGERYTSQGLDDAIKLGRQALESDALRSLRSTEGKEGEPVAQQHRVWFPDTQKWSEWREGSKPLYDNDFQTRTLYATPEAAEAHAAKLREALEPFADYADAVCRRRDDFVEVGWSGNRECDGEPASVNLTASMFRRARAALTRSPE